MRAAPPIQVALRSFGVWRLGVGALCGLSVLTSAAWWIGSRPRPPIAIAVAVLLILVAAIAMAWRSARVPALSLRWDGGSWHLGLALTAGEEPCHGSLHVAIDLGAWMMLRFVPEAPLPAGLPTWLPVQKRGMEGQWHGLRCAVHSPRSPAGPRAPADS